MPIRDDSAGSYGTWNNDDLSWLDYLKAKASDGGNALANLGSNLVQGFSPVGSSPEGNMAFQVPPIVSGIADSYARLAGTPNNPGNAYNLSGVPELDAPIQQDMSNVLLSLYGGNAVSGLAKGGAPRSFESAVSKSAPRVSYAGMPVAKLADNEWLHGSRHAGFDSFDPLAADKAGHLTNEGFDGVSLTKDAREASEYAGRRDGAAVYKLRHEPGNVFEWNVGDMAGTRQRLADISPDLASQYAIGDFPADRKAFSETLRNAGYDTIDIMDGADTLERAALRPGSVRLAATGDVFFSDTGKPSVLWSALATAGESIRDKAQALDVLADRNSFNDGSIPEQALTPYEIGQFNQQIRQRKINDGTLFSRGVPIPQYQDENLPPWLNF